MAILSIVFGIAGVALGVMTFERSTTSTSWMIGMIIATLVVALSAIAFVMTIT